MTETLIRDIERHFAPVLSDDKITTRPDEWWLFVHFTLRALSPLCVRRIRGGTASLGNS